MSRTINGEQIPEGTVMIRKTDQDYLEMRKKELHMEQFKNRKKIGYLRRKETGEEVCIDRPEWRIGKKEEINDYVIKENRAVSREHACIYWEREQYYVMDLGSVNGTYINDVEIEIDQKVELHNGDRIVFANERFQFLLKVKKEIPEKEPEKKEIKAHYCQYCGKEIHVGVGDKFCPECGKPIGTTSKTVERKPKKAVDVSAQRKKTEYPMKWYYFIIYVQLILGVVALVATGALYISGQYLEMYHDALFKAWVYAKVPGLRYMDIIIGVVNLAFIPVYLITRQKLVKFKKDAPKWYMGILIGNLVSYVLTNVSTAMYAELDYVSCGGSIVTSIVLIIANYIYFNKRKALFHN